MNWRERLGTPPRGRVVSREYRDDCEVDDPPPPPPPTQPHPPPPPPGGEGGCYDILPCRADEAPTPEPIPATPLVAETPALLFPPPGPDYAPIEGFPGYVIGRDRSVWSDKPRGGAGRPGAWRRLSTYLKGGLPRVSLWHQGRSVPRSVSRLWRDAFAAAPKVPSGDPRSGVSVRGSLHGMALLDEDKVREARRLRRGGWTTGQLARRFGVNRNTMCYALNGTTWRHVADDPAPPLPRPDPEAESCAG